VTSMCLSLVAGGGDVFGSCCLSTLWGFCLCFFCPSLTKMMKESSCLAKSMQLSGHWYISLKVDAAATWALQGFELFKPSSHWYEENCIGMAAMRIPYRFHLRSSRNMINLFSHLKVCFHFTAEKKQGFNGQRGESGPFLARETYTALSLCMTDNIVW